MNYQEQEAQRQYAAQINQTHPWAAAGAMAGSSLGEPMKEREGGVMRELRVMEKNIHALTASIDVLYNRLDTVYIPCPATNSCVEKERSGSGLTNQLYAFNSLLSDQIARLESLRQGIDL